MATRLACLYTGVSRWTLYRAVDAGELAPCGGRGRLKVFAREDLDRWMLGTATPPARASSQPATKPNASVDVLARLRAIKAGGR
jgi:excisionase family DNA binding protein